MRVYFLRHGIANPENWSGPDDERPLTEEGRERMARQAKAIANLGLRFDAIVTSPLVRAKQTAEIVARRLDASSRLSSDARLAFGFNARLLHEVLSERAGAESVLLVGHEPSMSATIGELVGGARLDFKKGSLAAVEVSGPAFAHGTLLWFVPPKVLLGS